MGKNRIIGSNRPEDSCGDKIGKGADRCMGGRHAPWKQNVQRAIRLICACMFLMLGGGIDFCFGGGQNGVEEEFQIDLPDRIVQAPKLMVPDLQNDIFDLKEYRGRVVLINFWATWCIQCIRELPSFQKLKERLGSDRFEIIAVNVQEPASRVRKFLSDKPYTFKFLLDQKGDIYRAYGVRVFPTTFIVDAQNRMVGRVVGERKWDRPKLVGYLRQLIGSG